MRRPEEAKDTEEQVNACVAKVEQEGERCSSVSRGPPPEVDLEALDLDVALWSRQGELLDEGEALLEP